MYTLIEAQNCCCLLLFSEQCPFFSVNCSSPNSCPAFRLSCASVFSPATLIVHLLSSPVNLPLLPLQLRVLSHPLMPCLVCSLIFVRAPLFSACPNPAHIASFSELWHRNAFVENASRSGSWNAPSHLLLFFQGCPTCGLWAARGPGWP